MKAVVLAAGLGTRLKANVPKPLVKVAGREILYRNLRILSELGIEEFIVVARDKRIEEFLIKHGFKYKIVWNNHPEKGNGYSLYLARDYIEDDFVLIMGDHVYERSFIERAVKGKGLIGDRIAKYVDKDEATKVQCKNGRVEKIGKELDKYDYIDTGFFVLGPDVFRYAEEIVKEKKDGEEIKLSEIIGRAKPPVTEVSGYFWMDVDTPEELKKARKELIRLSVKGFGDGIVSRIINRKISTWISEKIVDHVTPNQMTVITFLIGVFSALIALFNRPLAGLLYQISSILDGVDGEIARASMRESKLGGWVDSILDRYVDFLFLLALATTLNDIKMWIVAAFAIFGSFMVSYSTERYKAAFFEDVYKEIKPMRYLIGKRDERVFITMILCLIGWINELFIILAVLTNLRVALTMCLVLKHKHE
jgi:CDP-L-myo-inositol myo-inositolphosphotransferase